MAARSAGARQAIDESVSRSGSHVLIVCAALGTANVEASFQWRSGVRATLATLPYVVTMDVGTIWEQ